MRYIFMGTPNYGAIILRGLIEAGRIPLGVITQIDQPAGRGQVLTPPPVKTVALEYGIPLRQPKKIGEPTREWMRGLKPDICVVAAFGKILNRQTLDIPPYGCINAHASLLPRFRGAAPVAWAIAAGDTESGVSIMQMDEGIDTGDVLLQKGVPILEDDNCESLADRLAQTAVPMLIEAMDRIAEGTIERKPQASFDQEPTMAPCLVKADGLLNWNNPAEDIYHMIRGMNPWPGTFTFLDGKQFKILKAEVVDVDTCVEPGIVISVERDGIIVAAKEDGIRLTEVQLQGKKAMPAFDFANGYRLKPGTVFQDPPGSCKNT